MTTTRPDVELAVFTGGPWNGWWLDRPRLEDARAAEARTGRSMALGYQPTGQWRPHPKDPGEGRVWRWAPDDRALPDVVCRMCDWRAGPGTTTYCDRCAPATTAPAAPGEARFCACGTRLLLARPGRDRCEACRLGRSHPPLPTHPARPDQRETCGGCGQLTACADRRCLGCRAEPVAVEVAA